MAMTTRSDIIAHNPNGVLVAAVEVKNREDLTPRAAAALRRNMVMHGFVAQVPYFVLVSQEQGYLWRQHDLRDLESLPDAQFPMNRVLVRYLPPGFRDRLRGSELEAIVYSWLADVSQSVVPPTDEPERTLASTGFIDALRGATLAREVA